MCKFDNATERLLPALQPRSRDFAAKYHEFIRKKKICHMGKGTPELLGILGGGVPPGSPNPDPISDQKMSFFTPIFRLGLLSRNSVMITYKKVL